VSIYHVRKLVNKINKHTTATPSTKIAPPIVICQKCERVSSSTRSCSHRDCDNHEKYASKPYNYICFDILHQLEQILLREEYIKCFSLGNKSQINNVLCDIYDGEVYRMLLQQVETNQINGVITLVMNVDGVAIGNNTEESLWIITCVINEIKRKERYKIKNAIVAGICSCYKKPSRSIMQLLLKPIVEQMKSCANGFRLIRTFLIGTCNDKPACSLVQNAPEPIAKFGCSICELGGNHVASIV
jgi:hypothetical protein